MQERTENRQPVGDHADLEINPPAAAERGEEFERLWELTPDGLQTIAAAPFNFDRNRWKQFLPFDDNLYRHPDLPEFYVNASWVSAAGRTTLVSQGPLLTTLAEHWELIWQTGISTIAMLTNCVEGDLDKCAPYFPTADSLQSLGVSGTRIELEDETLLLDLEGVRIVERRLQAVRAGKPRGITHFQVENWPDWGVVAPEVLSKLIDCVQTSQRQTGGELLTHCSAGIGRSGTFLAAYCLDELLRGGEIRADRVPLLVPAATLELRSPQTGRPGMIQTLDQFNLVYDTLDLRGTAA